MARDRILHTTTLNDGFLINSVGASVHVAATDDDGRKIYSAVLHGQRGPESLEDSQVLLFDIYRAAQMVSQLRRVFHATGQGGAFDAIVDECSADLAEFYRTHQDPPLITIEETE